MPRLETLGVTVRFGGNLALDNVSLTIEPAQVTGLIGPNGAGKTTLFNVITGLLPATSGRVILDGRDITRTAPHKRAQLGLSRTFQRLELFTSLSVRDNLRAAGDIHRAWTMGRKADYASDVERILQLVGLSHLAHHDASDLPTGQARLVEVARALMIQPSILLLDEPASGQSETETVAFAQLISHLAHDTGMAICLVEHDMSLVMDVCDTIQVLDFGRAIAQGPPDVIRRDDAVINAYLGTPKEAA